MRTATNGGIAHPDDVLLTDREYSPVSEPLLKLIASSRVAALTRSVLEVPETV